MKKLSEKLSYSKKIFMVFAVLCSISILLIAGSYYIRMYLDARKRAQQEFLDIGTRTAQGLEREIDIMDMVSCQIFGSRTIQRHLFDAVENKEEHINYFEQNPDARNAVQEVLWSFNSPRKVVANLSIIYPDTFIGLLEIPGVDDVNRVWDQGLYEGWIDGYRMLPAHEDPFAISKEKDRIAVSLLRKLTLSFFSQEEAGVIEVQQSYDKFEEICIQNYNKVEMSLYVLDAKGSIIYPYSGSSVTKESEKITEMFHGLPENTLITDIDGRMGVGMQHTLSNAPWKVILFQDRAQFFGPIFGSLQWVVILGVCMLVLTVSVVYFVTKRIMTPITELRKMVENGGDSETVDFSDLKIEINEIELLQRAFSKMIHHIKQSAELMSAMREKELELKIAALQSQINPHFLYNSLAAIGAAGLEDGSFKTQMMCVDLSELLRYAGSDTEKKVDLQTELDNLRTYLQCMKWRYEENLQYDLVIEGKTNVDFIPKLTFQPLVENSFAHGFSDIRPPYKIKVQCIVSEEGWIFETWDNGAGIAEDKLKQIRESISNINHIFEESKDYDSLRTENMAILNIYMRLKREYGKQVRFSIVSGAGKEGTQIKIEVAR